MSTTDFSRLLAKLVFSPLLRVKNVPGERLALDANIREAIISPKQDYAIASRAADAQTVVIETVTVRLATLREAPRPRRRYYGRGRASVIEISSTVSGRCISAL
jgi:hypothetical protein